MHDPLNDNTRGDDLVDQAWPGQGAFGQETAAINIRCIEGIALQPSPSRTLTVGLCDPAYARCFPASHPTAPMARSATSSARASSVVAMVSFQRLR